MDERPRERIDAPGNRVAVASLGDLFPRCGQIAASLGPCPVITLFSSRPLTLAEVHAALAYHYDHPEELEGYLQRSAQVEKEIEAASGF